MELIRAVTAVCVLLVVLATAAAGTLPAQGVTVSPTGLYIDHRTRTATLTLFNPGDLPAEIGVEFAFGYPRSDADGTISVALTREPEAGEPSAAGWLRAFPSRLVLQPGQRQVVRVLVDPPAGLPDGEYWARVIVSSRGSEPAITAEQDAVRFQLNVRSNLVLAVNYRNGAVTTGVELASAVATRTCDGVRLELDLRRTGNAAFLGGLRAELVDARGQVLSSTYDDLAVYQTMHRRLRLPLPSGGAEPFHVRVVIGSGRADLPASAALPATAVSSLVPVLDEVCVGSQSLPAPRPGPAGIG
jgi:hypothetical protein